MIIKKTDLFIETSLGVDESNRIIHYKPSLKIGANLLINPCRTPATHPQLWQNARDIYWSFINRTNSKPNRLIYLQRTRSNARNAGRIILNEQVVIDYLRNFAKNNSLVYVQYDHSSHTENIQTQIELFSRAKIIFGIHGGALSNINFAQSNTFIIEIMPFRQDKPSLPIVCANSNPNLLQPCVGYIYYVQSQLLNQSYWILPTVVDKESNVNVNMTKLELLFNSLSIQN